MGQKQIPAWSEGFMTMRDFPVSRNVSWASADLQKLLPDPVASIAPSLTDHFPSHIHPISVLPSNISLEPGKTSGGESSALPGPRPPSEGTPPPPSPAGADGAASLAPP